MASKSRPRSGFLFMLIVVVLLGSIIFTFKDRLSVLFNTGFSAGKNFINKNFDKKDDTNLAKKKIEELDKKDDADEKIRDNIDSIKENLKDIKNKLTQNESSSKESKQAEKEKESAASNNEKSKTANEKKTSLNAENIKKDSGSQNKDKKQINQRTSKLYFSRINSSDKLLLVSVDRNVTYTNTPLTETITSLLKGPNENEKAKEVISNIPQNSKLISVSIKENIAFVNFSKEFEYNPFGKDATVTQIKQIVYTATEFSNIKSVQILIDGRIKKYLGGEGIIINKPLARSDFS